MLYLKNYITVTKAPTIRRNVFPADKRLTLTFGISNYTAQINLSYVLRTR